MQIIEVELGVSDAQKALEWYSEVLGLAPNGAEVRIGTTSLRLLDDERVQGTGHLAFEVATDRFDAARGWLAARVPLLANAEGQDEFAGPDGWKSRSVYFTGGVGEILEFICHEDIGPSGVTGPFSADELLRVSEVGVALPDAAQTRADLRRVGIDDYHQTGPEFAPVGDVHGLLIAVAVGRAWAPTWVTKAEVSPLRVVARTGVEGRVVLNEVAELVTLA